MTPSSSGPTPLNPRGRGGGAEPDPEGERPQAEPHERSESAISNEAQAVRTLASAHRLAGEIENEARRRADEIGAEAELRASQHERDAQTQAEAIVAEAKAERDRIWEQIRAGVGRATRQVGDLIHLREELRLDLHEAMHSSRSALTRLGDGEESADPAVPLSRPPGEAPELPPAPDPLPEPPIAGRASEVGASGPHRGSPLSPSGAVAAEPPGATDTLASLRAGPFESFLAVMQFERELAGLAPIDAVYVRRFANGEVDVEIEAHGGPDDLREALGGMPAVETVENAGGVLRLRMRHEAPTGE